MFMNKLFKLFLILGVILFSLVGCSNKDEEIITAYIQYAHSIGLTDVDINNAEILENYGEYSESSIVKMNRTTKQVITCLSFKDIDLKMEFPDSNLPLVYNDGNIYELRDAYDHGMLTKENLITLQEKIGTNIINKHFDLTDEKIIFKGNINDKTYCDDEVIIILKKAYDDCKLDLSAFGLDNAISMRYIMGPKKSTEEYSFRSIICIYLEPEGKEKLLETIRNIEDLEFIYYVEPNSWQEGD